MLRDKVTQFYVELDDFCKEFELSKKPLLSSSGVKSRNRKGSLSDSEMMSIYLLFHFGQFTNFKSFYVSYVQKHLDDLFPDLISYERFNARQHRVLVPLMLYLKHRGLGKSRGINISTLPCFEYVISNEKNNTKSSKESQLKENQQWDGSLVSNFT